MSDAMDRSRNASLAAAAFARNKPGLMRVWAAGLDFLACVLVDDQPDAFEWLKKASFHLKQAADALGPLAVQIAEPGEEGGEGDRTE
ncbi:hypothetical protein [Paludisphaera soli]|uniref:hypothetical protein n=1 Tax=Paludisphaera soli TaxID=2712865 RepID=UPI0013ED3EA0|nr:hypothetical protein [Paludisphaera soli]